MKRNVHLFLLILSLWYGLKLPSCKRCNNLFATLSLPKTWLKMERDYTEEDQVQLHHICPSVGKTRETLSNECTLCETLSVGLCISVC
jgi:hypothetical protein